jgi:LysM repeat protein
MLGLEYQAAGLAATRSMIKSRPELFQSLMKAYVEAIHYYKTHPRESMAILSKYLKMDDPDALRETYEGVGLALVPERPYPTLKGIQMILGEMGSSEPKAQTAKPEQFVDLTFIKELEGTGFIDRLYKARPALTSVEGSRAAAPVSLASKPAPAPQEKSKPAAPAAKPAPAPAPAGKTAAQEYIVKAGDSLGRIAQKYYGDIFKWNKIYEANRQTLKTPDYIYVGQKLVIPADDAAGGLVTGAAK